LILLAISQSQNFWNFWELRSRANGREQRFLQGGKALIGEVKRLILRKNLRAKIFPRFGARC